MWWSQSIKEVGCDALLGIWTLMMLVAGAADHDAVIPNAKLSIEGPSFNPWVGKMPWRRKWQPTPGFLTGESHGQEKPGVLQSMGSQRVRHPEGNTEGPGTASSEPLLPS